ncbi:low specificity L-threonine aldolase [Leptolyngbya sp. FACHB-261]|uniref:threonine aldolase family protein n=1 Tax=Leptolyngbya sp. FACHB-261 TaxID=2692806 RepID=UPI00168412EE|nr:low specificity L-threonine aldolase [Leptolyngbya sp. FACHB-261]MBD2104819.1 low specificity L-threonine aldolase [Leptolyngbya sp. FACHB-261]
MNFGSDNVTGVAPEIMAALVAANEGSATSYGNDEISQRLTAHFSELFETAITVFPVATGSAANALALSVLTPPYGSIYCHNQAHIEVDECGAPEFYTGGAKLVLLPGQHGRIQAADLTAALANAGTGVVHHVQPAALSLTQATEAGTVYTPEAVSELAEIAHAHNLGVHMDGARFANAVVGLNCSPADITWRAGVDVLSFGATKNGAMAAEAVVFFKPELAASFGYRRKRAGHLFSKMRYLSAQLEAYITDDLWLRNATRANDMAAKLAAGLATLPGAALKHPVEANEIFVSLPETVVDGLLADGFHFYRWDRDSIRLVTAFNTQVADVTALLEAAQRYSQIDHQLDSQMDQVNSQTGNSQTSLSVA